MGLTATSEDRRSLSLAGAGVELRAGDGGGKRFFGHAAVFDQRTAIGNPLTWGFYEEIAPGAFTKTLSEQDVRKLIDHDSYYVVSRMSAGTLELAEDDTGLAVDSALDTGLSYVNDLIVNLGNGNITGMSFGFYVIKDDWWNEDVALADGYKAQVEVRRLLEVKLVEVSSVTFPAFPQTDAGLRSGRGTRMCAEDEVRAVGLALGRREGGAELIEARSSLCPGLADYRERPVCRSRPAPELRGPVKSHSTDTNDGAWNGPANEKNLPDDAKAATLKKVYAWQDPDGDADSKSSWKFPHHFVDSDGKVGAASTKACTAGIAVLNGGRGGSDIPDADRQGVHAHLAKHLKDAGEEPADLKSLDEPGESTRGDEHDQASQEGEPAASTRPPYLDLVTSRMNALAVMHGLPTG